jgi:hypothetical protein
MEVNGTTDVVGEETEHRHADERNLETRIPSDEQNRQEHVQFHFHERGVDESPEKLAPDEAEAPDIEKDAEDVKACHLHDAASCEQYKQANVDGQKARGNARRNYLRRSCVEVFVYHLGQSLIIAYPLYPICKVQGAKLAPFYPFCTL